MAGGVNLYWELIRDELTGIVAIIGPYVLDSIISDSFEKGKTAEYYHFKGMRPPSYCHQDELPFS